MTLDSTIGSCEILNQRRIKLTAGRSARGVYIAGCSSDEGAGGNEP